MTTATLVRRRLGATSRAGSYADDDTIEPEIIFKGELCAAIERARALPWRERAEVTLETEGAFFGPDDFDVMTAEAVPFRDLDMIDGSGLIRIEAGALEQLQGGRPGLVPPMAIVQAHLETLTAIVSHKKLTSDFEEADGKRLVTITAADIAAA